MRVSREVLGTDRQSLGRAHLDNQYFLFAKTGKVTIDPDRQLP